MNQVEEPHSSMTFVDPSGEETRIYLFNQKQCAELQWWLNINKLGNSSKECGCEEEEDDFSEIVENKVKDILTRNNEVS